MVVLIGIIHLILLVSEVLTLNIVAFFCSNCNVFDPLLYGTIFIDEPALIFRRNAFLTVEEESQITDEAILNILLMEVRLNIQQGVHHNSCYPLCPLEIVNCGLCNH